MWAGELAAVERARHKIAQKQRRDNFLFGCGGFRYPYEDRPILKEVFDSLFNYATLPFYLARLEPEMGKPDYTLLDKLVNGFEARGIQTKAHPLWWTHTAGMPPWTENLKWEDGSIAREIKRVVHRSVSRYKGRVKYYDVINEAHDWCNAYNLSQRQLVEMTKLCCDAVREIDPGAVTIVNTCFMFGENVADNRVQWGIINERNMTPQSYMHKLHELGADYDVIGIQLYFPARDMLAIDKLYDRFSVFKKPLHLTELGVPSHDRDVPPNCTVGDVYCLRYMYHGLWREMGWSQRLQADWLEDFYTLSYARDEVEALTWWSISDNPSYVPAAGLVNQNGIPKQSAFRLKELQKSWGFNFGRSF
jgi:GH35 family endo-1,4-beta-xylanase